MEQERLNNAIQSFIITWKRSKITLYQLFPSTRKGAWVDLAAETATVSVFDAAVALMARGCGGPVAFRNLLSDPAALAAKLSRAPAPQQVTTLQGLSEASWAP